jgi:hypothetical protein
MGGLAHGGEHWFVLGNNSMDPILKGKRAISTGKIRLTFPSPLMAVISIKWIKNVETTEAITKYRN